MTSPMEQWHNCETPFELLIKEKATEGWQFMASEKLTTTKFNPANALFEDVPLQSEEEIRTRYEKEGIEVELILAPIPMMEDLRKIMDNDEFSKLEPADKDKSYYVFCKQTAGA